MKTIKNIFITGCVLVGLTSCDKGFEDLNKNPYAINDLDASFILAHAQQGLSFGSWEGEGTLSQFFVNAYDLGATAGFQFNQNNNNYTQMRWGNYGGPIKNLVQAEYNLNGDPARTNLISMIRIWKALMFMNLVDTHGDVPYSEAGKAYIAQIYSPKYDDDAEIYEDLYKEIKEATAALNNGGEIVTADLIYKGNIDKWRKMGNSLLLRLGMRYSKLNPTKAASIVAEAYSAGVMETSDDDAILFYNTLYSNPMMNGITTNNPRTFYLYEALINHYVNYNDPRSRYVAGKYPNPQVVTVTQPDVTLSEQIGWPLGVEAGAEIAKWKSDTTLVDRSKQSGVDYSQPNYFSVFSFLAPRFFITASQTKFLLAEAAYRGWITGDVETLYNEGIKESMKQYAHYPGGYGSISDDEIEDYSTQTGVAYNATKALELINTEYWVSNLNNPLEAWSNFRRSGFPNLAVNTFAGGLPGDGFVHRVPYPTQEGGSNPDNYAAARDAMGILPDNSNDMTVRVFWDVEVN